MLQPRGGLLFTLTVSCLIYSAQGSKFDFYSTVLPPLTQISRRHGMFSPDGSPAIGPPGNGRSYIELDVSFRRLKSKTEAFRPASVQAIIFHNSEVDNVKRAAESGHFCCTMKNAKSNEYGCYVAGEFVPTYQPLYKIDLALPSNGSAAKLSGQYDIQQTGMHHLMYSSCQHDAGNVYIDGHNAWMNPYGYLAGELYYNKPFFMGMAIVHALALVSWLGLLFKFREEVLPVQGHICGVIVLALLEVLLWYFEYSSVNAHGARPMALMVSAIICGTIKKTLSRLLVLVVCMGYGIVRPNLGSSACQIAMFGVVYCIFSSVFDVIKALSHDNDVTGGFFVLVIIPVAILDSIFYLWTFVSLYDVVARLQERRQTVKLQLYRQFIWVLGTCLVLSFGWVLYQMYFLYANLFPTYWEYAWLFDAYWYVLGLAILLAIMYLWAPNENSKRYALYEENVNIDGDDGMSMELEHQEDNSLAPAFSIDGEEGEECKEADDDDDVEAFKEDCQPSSDQKHAMDDI